MNKFLFYFFIFFCANIFAHTDSIAEKYHYSELPILDICRRMDEMSMFIIQLQKYAAIVSPSLYDTILLFLDIASLFNKGLK